MQPIEYQISFTVEDIDVGCLTSYSVPPPGSIIIIENNLTPDGEITGELPAETYKVRVCQTYYRIVTLHREGLPPINKCHVDIDCEFE